MGSDEQQSTSAIGDEVRAWVRTAQAITSARQDIADVSAAQIVALSQRAIEVCRNGERQWHVIPVGSADEALVKDVAKGTCLPRIDADTQRELDRLTNEVAAAVRDFRKITGLGRLLLFGGTRDKANQAAKFLSEYHQWFLTSGVGNAMKQLALVEDERINALTVQDALADWVGLKPRLPERGRAASIEYSTSFAILPNATAIIRRASMEEARLRTLALEAGNTVRRAETNRMLSEMSVERLREVTRDKIRVGALTENGITNVLSVLINEDNLEYLGGIGATSATRIRAAARALHQNTLDEMPMRIDIKNRTKEHTQFLRQLRGWDGARRASASSVDMAIVDELAPLAAAIDGTVTHVIVIPAGSASIDDFRASVQTVARTARAIADAQDLAATGDPWPDFLTRPADYFALLAELGFITEDDEKSHGDLPAEIIDAVRDFVLDGDYLTASLRGYQSFAARFALVQRKVVIGDEMGLGKTVEAIAALAHLRARGEHNFIVVCPAAVVTNWVREVTAKSRLSVYRLHGPDRQWAAKNWVRKGGVAVTTFETLRWLTENVSIPKLGCVVVDEAHYIKNPEALRTRRTSKLINASDRAILLTGTPLENRIDEFRNLVGYLRPDLVVDANEFSPRKFRRQVAPAYIRRNQEDVLTELPELVEVDEWIAMSSDDSSAYRAAVREQNFMAMRQSAMRQGLKSTKMQRLVEIVEEAEANDRRVVVFSHFLDVLRDVAAHVPGRVFGPLTGSVAASQRQVMVDDFSAASKGAVLVAQILAGGVGLNIQAASVVVICEPQLKPTTEWQAIARAHRMGQLESVQVHRLLSDEGVDERLVQLLAVKKQVFEDFAKLSETAESAPEAYDVSETELAKKIISAERERLLAGPPAASGALAPALEPPASGRAPREIFSERRSVRSTSTTSSERPLESARYKPGVSVHSDHPSNSTRQEEFSSAAQIPGRQASNGAGLRPYPVFAERLAPISRDSEAHVVKHVVEIVRVEGPLTGWRIHQVYWKCLDQSESHDDFARLLNRAISAAERRGLVVSENPLNQSGNKPRTFRLPSQAPALVRELGPRTLGVVPPRELKLLWAEVDRDESMSNEDVFALIGKKLQIPQLSAADRSALGAARRLRV